MGTDQLFQQGGYRTFSRRNDHGRSTLSPLICARPVFCSLDSKHDQFFAFLLEFGRQSFALVLSVYEVRTFILHSTLANATHVSVFHFRALVNESLVTVFHAHLRHIDQAVSNGSQKEFESHLPYFPHFVFLQLRSERLKQVDPKFVQRNAAFLLDTLLSLVSDS